MLYRPEISSAEHWEEYYNKVYPVAFEKQSGFYLKAISFLSKYESSILDENEPKTFILGGFHPNVSTVNDFVKFVKELNNNPDNKLIFLDMNYRPLASLDSNQFPFRVQSRLEDLSFRPSTIDLLFLDFTLYFMNDEQIQRFSNSVNNLLKPKGIVLAAIPPLGIIDRFFKKREGYVPVYPRSAERIRSLASGLKLSYWGEGKSAGLLAFSRFNNNFPIHKGLPYDLDYKYNNYIRSS